jgi:hypothetical protein
MLNPGHRTLSLLASDVVDASSWLWRLVDEEGIVLATQSVQLDTRTVEFEALTGLEDFFRLRISPDRRLPQQAEWLDRLGSWISENVLGSPITQTLHAITEPAPPPSGFGFRQRRDFSRRTPWNWPASARPGLRTEVSPCCTSPRERSRRVHPAPYPSYASLRSSARRLPATRLHSDGNASRSRNSWRIYGLSRT